VIIKYLVSNEKKYLTEGWLAVLVNLRDKLSKGLAHRDMHINHLSDFLVRFQNKRDWGTALRIYNSKFIFKLLEKLQRTKLIDYIIERETFKYLDIKVLDNSITSMVLISKPSRPVYTRYHELLNDSRLKKTGSFYILSNSQWGLLTSEEALELKVGGKLILFLG